MKHSQLSLERTFVGGPYLPQVGHFYKQRSNNKTDVATGSSGWFCLAGRREWRILDGGIAATLSLTPSSELHTLHTSSLILSTGPELPPSLRVEPHSEMQGCSCSPAPQSSRSQVQTSCLEAPPWQVPSHSSPPGVSHPKASSFPPRSAVA